MTQRTDTHLELYVRTQTPSLVTERLDALRAELTTLASEHDWSFGVTQWPTKIERAADCSGNSVADRLYDQFAAWADENDVTLSPAFETRRCYSWETGDPYEALILPVACLTVSRDGDLSSVYPHRDETGTTTIPDAIETLGAGKPAAVSEPDEESPPPALLLP